MSDLPISQGTPEWWKPQNLTQAIQASEMIANSSLVPSNYRGKPGDVLIAMQLGAEVGLSPMAALQNVAVVNGTPSLYGDALLAVCKSHPEWEWIKEEYRDNLKAAVCTVKRKGEPETVRSFSEGDAKLAKLWGKQGPWSQYPKRMLQMRARGFALRDTFPDALRGIISREEAEDLPREKPATLAQPEAPEGATTAERVLHRIQSRTAAKAAPEPDIAEDDIVVPDDETAADDPQEARAIEAEVKRRVMEKVGGDADEAGEVLADLCRAAEVDKPERGNGSVATWRAIAAALDADPAFAEEGDR